VNVIVGGKLNYLCAQLNAMPRRYKACRSMGSCILNCPTGWKRVIDSLSRSL